MVLVLKNGNDAKKLKEALVNRKAQKGFDAKRFCGMLKVDEHALVIQRRLRDEWN